ncbi:MAG: mechanosensitive ion channel family protein [Acidobacteria bacterium]|nr:mechanosensitive ion channel family protein [Acidobacteriota bacterium]
MKILADVPHQLPQVLALFAPHEKLQRFLYNLSDRFLDELGNFITKDLPQLIFIAICAWLLVRLLKMLTEHIIRVAERHSASGSRLSQVRTLSSVIRATGIGIIAFLAILQVLPVLGLNLGPLLTSAGVAGVAIGLAAQTIVKDCLNGFLILIEDQYNVGDVVKIAGLGGTIESMSLRKTMLRGFDGTLYVVPNSQISIVANSVRDFSVATLSISVDFSADPDKVIAVLKEVTMSVRQDPAYKDLYLEDPQVLGVDSIKGSQVIYLIVLKTRANQQWGPQRETQRRIRIALEKNDMLPGDPLRVYNDGRQLAISTAQHPPQDPARPVVDPTTVKPPEINPFTGEGL